jgi:hypothetical protein
MIVDGLKAVLQFIPAGYLPMRGDSANHMDIPAKPA